MVVGCLSGAAGVAGDANGRAHNHPLTDALIQPIGNIFAQPIGNIFADLLGNGRTTHPYIAVFTNGSANCAQCRLAHRYPVTVTRHPNTRTCLPAATTPQTRLPAQRFG
ncbi:MAG: hypothetical protein BroJett015_23490 [Chloroflexota bacterium]|nr:MAG: hypothetical protein BroJett015_23490 [Chloroflexota bacterium]